MKIAIIGCGVMGTAFAKHFAREHTILLCDKNHKKASALAKEIGGEAYERFHEAIQSAEVVLLAVKPKDLPEVAKHTASSFSKKQLLISLLAGTSLSVLKKYYPEATILRIMPNIALTCGQAVIGMVDDHLSHEMKTKGEYLLKGLGLLTWLPENKIEALSALTGSGPAFLFVIIESMIDGGIAMGFTAQESKDYVLKTIEGSVALLKETEKHPGALKWEVASPGGTTIAGLREMESMRVRAGLMNTLLVCYQRNLQMREDIEK